MKSGSTMRIVSMLLVVLSLSAIGAVASAHEGRPLYVELRETSLHRFELSWKIPPSVPLAAAPAVMLASKCQLRGPHTERRLDDGWLRQSTFDCPNDIAGASLILKYPYGPTSLPTLIRVERYSGERHLETLPASADSWRIPVAESRSGVAKSYSLLGVRHVLAGYDHLLFLLCLLWISGSWKRVLVTVTGFTAAHSITLTLSALGVVSLPVAPVEATIALSILFLATELARNRRDSLTWRYPVAVSSAFGLVHGLGFASALAETGLPQVEIVSGLLFFNVGVEIGQLLVVAGVVLATILASRALSTFADNVRLLNATRVVASYFVGTIASYWVLQRCMVL